MNGRMQRLLVWGLSLQCAAALTATARLDETEEQSRQRYGEPMAKETDPLTYAPMIEGAVHHTYKYQGWRMQAAFVEGKTVRISYMKIGGKNDRPTIQDAEVLAILES